MCGITGWVDWEVDLSRQQPVLEAMTATLACRGPDASGVWLSPRAALGHRRLIVVDPAGGGQPMVRHRGNQTFVISYNGELYNTPDLHRELKSHGYTFQGHSDTEALLAAYMEWGPACVERFNGIFAFAIWDEARQSLFLARDRLGVKPLFYTQRGSAFLFGSELKALLAHPAVEAEVDAEGLAEVFVLGPARTPGHGVFRNIAELKPGYYLIYDRQGIRQHQYWALVSRPHPDDLETTTAKVRQLLQDTVERQLVADVPVCTLLSGGLDSSAVTAFAARAFQERGLGPIHTWSVDYVDNDRYFRPSHFQPNSDAPWVELVSRYLGTRHHYVFIDTPELVTSLTTAMRARDLPGMADVDSSLYLFSREIKKEATVALSGEAADEVFGGYPWFRSEKAMALATFPWTRAGHERIRLLSPDLKALVRPEEYVARRYREALEEVPRLPGEDPRSARLREFSYLTLTRFMPVLLDRKDRMSMAVGLEVRVPYCDHRLVDYVWNIPWEMKFWGQMEKGILRRALRGVLPEEVLQRRKSPYPKTYNPAYLEAVRTWLLEILNDPGSPLLPFIDVPAIRALAEKEEPFDLPWFGQLMSAPQLFAYLAQADTWLREYRIAVR
ncbi:Asparagine synthetase [glutamine-hydrolyzing] 3 [Neomoorella glycerini]|uniref:asparagine synthase (glutamine-hydrolyzing) n=1 Tax=Neomoorella glycerini TaxID=55779 RepID=A0A6I5ZMM4_9FIRM|nr:asparagine synthase (glutamine-hydrolyzing) [Moorella glycerini]QGP91118.1 Asparagine synthetase [glutamine-hydrolyzing] 3 [Moorella glycerini]